MVLQPIVPLTWSFVGPHESAPVQLGGIGPDDKDIVLGTGQVRCEPQWHSALGRADVARLSLDQQGETGP
jgi:hypothetical protein